MHFVIHAVDRPDALPTRAKFYRDHRIHLDQADRHGVAVTTAGTLVAPDGETPVGSLFILEAADRAIERDRGWSPVPGVPGNESGDQISNEHLGKQFE